ncbi:MAG TPA: hypothetical protein VFT49_04370 [Candidatus Saccharimonadales bacterium]|nr:hypothetical protein [Candidatus Saccharimonadales bacterium]
MRKLSFKRLGLYAAIPAVIVGVAAIVSAAATFGPSRPTFTWADPANYITFNSITDNPTWGDERQLLKTRDLNSSTSAYSTSTQVTDGEDVVLAVYFHNNAATFLGLSATNTQVKIVLPSGSASTQTATAYISADNANPAQVWATAELTNAQPFSLTYEPGTAKLYTNYVNGIALSDNVVNGGTLVGSNGPDGKVPGCAQFSGYVTIRAKVHVQPVQQTFSATATASATASASAKATCPNTGASASATASASASATATATSNVSQADAQSKAQNQAQQQANANAQAKAKADAQAKANASVNCSTPVTTTTSTPKPTALPNTGAGDVVGLFSGISTVGAAGHYIVNRRNRR